MPLCPGVDDSKHVGGVFFTVRIQVYQWSTLLLGTQVFASGFLLCFVGFFVHGEMELSEANMLSVCENLRNGAILAGHLLFTSYLAKTNYWETPWLILLGIPGDSWLGGRKSEALPAFMEGSIISASTRQREKGKPSVLRGRAFGKACLHTFH